MNKTIVHTLFLGLFSFPTLASTESYLLLKDRRTAMKLPSMTLAEKELVLNQAKLVLGEIFVHRDLKLKHFGNQIDPLPMIDQLNRDLSTISEGDFHQALQNIFLKQNDAHTLYRLPKPYSCYRNFLPFRFKEVSINGEKRLVIRSIVDHPEVNKLLPSLAPASPGDVLLSYDGLTAEQAVRKFDLLSAGANPEAKRLRSIRLLNSISQRLTLAPTKNQLELVLKKNNGQSYRMNVPWISEADQECLKEVSSTNAPAFMADEEWNEFNRFYRPRPKKNTSTHKNKFRVTVKETREPILKYDIINNANGSFGYIMLESFVPEKLTVSELVLEVRDLLVTKLKDTKGLIFDVRDNTGGKIALAEGLAQLFAPQNLNLLKFSLKASDANLEYMKVREGSSPRYVTAIQDAQVKGQTYTRALEIIFPTDYPNVGQVYTKPVAVLTNAVCYSSCDMFSAQMQDHTKAIIVGESSTTGAGGANNINHLAAVKMVGDSSEFFRKLPHGIDIGFAFRQTFRTGRNAGKLIEDTGILSDVQISPTLEDVVNNDVQIFNTITSRLKRIR